MTAPPIELPELLDHIDGSWQAPSDTLDAWIEDPNRGGNRQRQGATAEAALDAALTAAERVHRSGDWSARPPGERAAALLTMQQHLEKEVPAVALLESSESGAVLAITSMLGFILHGAFALAAQQLDSGLLSTTFDGPTGRPVEVDRLPWGPALLLCPWNAPAPMAAHKAASALAAGCPIIIKPPERAPHGTAAIARAAEAAGLPPGVVQLVHGGPAQATRLMTDPRIRAVSFTGGVVGGRAVAHACAEGLKPAQLELGGHSPLVILPDAELAHAVEAVVSLLTTLNGQWCRALGRVLAPTSRLDELVDAVTAALTEVRLGDSTDIGSQMGPIVHSSHRAMLHDRVQQLVGLGGTAIAPTPLPGGELAGGNWMSPTLITGVDPARTTDEVFGPVATVHGYSDVDQAVALANGTEYGLEAYVVGTDEDAAMAVARRIRAGGVKVNGASPISLHLMAPRSAFGLSGLHDEGTAETIEFFAGHRVVGVEGSLGAGPSH